MKKPLSLTLACLLATASLLLTAALAQNETGTRPAPRTRPGDAKLGRVFRSYERLSLDTAAAAARVRRTGRLAVNTGRRAFSLELEPHDLRAQNYRAEETVAPGVTLPVARGPVRTYRGKALGIEGSLEARFTIDDESFEGLILAQGERYYVEPAARYTPGAARTDFILYKASDVIGTEPASCAVESLHDKLGAAAGRVGKEPSVAAALAGGGPSPQALASPLEAEIATEADFEYVTALGGAAAANAEIVDIMNQVEGIYQTEIGLSFKITYQHAWATASDPYTTVDPVAAIKEFTNEWNNDPHAVGFKNVVRDVVHMWTGKNLTGTAGLAWTGEVCEVGGDPYALSERISRMPQRVILPAHEIGHSLGANHSDGKTGCTNTVMQAVATDSSVLSFCTTSRNEITTYINANAACLSAAPVCTFSISPTSTSVPAAGGSDTFSVTASDAGCAWTAVSNATWITITAGASGNGSGRVSFTADANTATTQRTGTITAAGKTFTVTQAGAVACTFTLATTSASLPAAGGTGTITVTGPSSCNWTAVSNVTWIHITAGASGSGDGTASFTVDAKTATTSRQGTITIAGKTYTVSQAAAACTFSISPTSASFTSAGGTGRITVTTTAGCAWTAKSNVAWITITAGASGSGSGAVSYSVAANTSTASRTGTITAAGKTFTVTQASVPPSLSSLVVNPPTVIGGCGSATGTVTLSAVAPTGGVVVTLSDNLAATTMPASLTVPAGARTRTFTISTAAVTTNQSGTVTAKTGASTKTDTLTVRRMGVRVVSVAPNPIIGGNTATGTVTLECAAAPGNITVTLSDTLAATTLPASVVVPAGATSKTFQITTVAVSANQNGPLTASAGGVSKSVNVTVRRIGLSSLTLNPNPVTGGQSTTGTVTLERAAGPGNIVVSLTSSNPSVASVPASVTIPAGTKSKTFTVTTNGVQNTTTATITTTANGTTKSVTLTINPGGG